MLQEIGKVKFVQIQTASLKRGQRPHSYYDPAALLVVERVQLSADGAIGIAGSAQWVDIHHAGHPQTKNRRNTNSFSIGFTSHYQVMRDRFGAHLADGCAGENMLVETDRAFSLADLGAGLIVWRAAEPGIRLMNLSVAAPCVEFSRFANTAAEPLSSDELRATLEFLDNGRRGFYARPDDRQHGLDIQAGDRVFAEL